MSHLLPRRTALLALAGLTLACATSSSAAHEAQLAALERSYAAHSVRIHGVSLDLDRLTVTQRQVVATYAEAERVWSSASQLSREAASMSQAARRNYDKAAADYAEAERMYRLASLAIATIAMGSIVCQGALKTGQYRAQLKRQGIDLDGKDIDHIFPRSRGGLDHPLNYQVLDASLNRSLGNKLVAKVMQAPLGSVVGLAVSALGALGGCN